MTHLTIAPTDQCILRPCVGYFYVISGDQFSFSPYACYCTTSVFITSNDLNIILMGRLVHMEIYLEMAIALLAPSICCDHLLILTNLVWPCFHLYIFNPMTFPSWIYWALPIKHSLIYNITSLISHLYYEIAFTFLGTILFHITAIILL